MDLPPTLDPPGGASSSRGQSRVSARLERLRAARRRVCADQADEAREVAGLVEECRVEARERVLALGDTDLDMDAEEFAHRQVVDSVMCGLAVGKNEATILVNLVDRLDVLPEVWEAWQAGVLDASRVRVLAGATDVLDDDTGAVQRVVRLDRDTARSCGSREALTTAVREALAQAPPLQVDTHDPSEAITAPESLPGTRLDPLPAAG